MKAVILAAGKATRLLPLTKDTPQSLLKVGNKTILERQINTLSECNINEVIVATGYLSDKIAQFLRGEKAKVLFNPFYSVSGMLMTLWTIREELKDEFILVYSDVLFEKSIINGLLGCKQDICMATKKNNPREEAEKVLEKDGVIYEIGKTGAKRNASAEFVGIAKFSEKGAKLLVGEMEEISKVQLNANFIDAIQAIVSKGQKIWDYDIGNAKWVDIDFKEDLKLANELFAD